MTREEAIDILKDCELNPCVPEDKEAVNMAIKVLKNNDTTNFKDELKTLVVKRLDEINHLIAGCNSPFTYSQIREAQELMCDIRTTLGIEDELE
jgi:hypothetical protein